MALLEVRDLVVSFQTSEGLINAVNRLSFSIDRGRTLAIVGESGSGKSQSAFAVLGLLANNGIATGSVKFNGEEILNAPLSQLNNVRASQLSMIFQDPMTSLNPYMRICDQMSEVLMHHKGVSKSQALSESLQMLDAVEISDAKSRINLYPHEFSGGMRQRIMIAISLLCRPKLLIADEPTTALDVTIQAQIMSLLSRLQKEFEMGIVMITHDLGVVAGFCEEILVLYGGQVMEQGPVDAIFASASHPYTRGLLKAIPRIDEVVDTLETIPGSPPNMSGSPKGCPFEPRCQNVIEECAEQNPKLIPFSNDRLRACNRSIEDLA